MTPRILGTALIAFGAFGCGYTSEYIPPPDGRPRVVMMGSDVALVEGVLAPECMVSSGAAAAPPAGVEGDHGGGGLRLDPGPGRVDIGGGGSLRVRVPSLSGVGRVLVPPHGLQLSGGGGGGGGGGFRGGDIGKGAIIIPILAMTAFTWIALGLAIGRPEDEAATAAAIDSSNVARDRPVRVLASTCDPRRRTF